MSRTHWKQREREAAMLIAGTRYPANQGGPIDCESAGYCCQVKEVRVLSLAALESLAVEIERVATRKNPPKTGLVMVKRSAGRGVKTPTLVVMTAATFREMVTKSGLTGGGSTSTLHARTPQLTRKGTSPPTRPRGRREARRGGRILGGG